MSVVTTIQSYLKHGAVYITVMGTNRPLLQPNLRLTVTPDEQIDPMGPDHTDTLEAEVNRRARKAEANGVGHITVHQDLQTNSVIFDLDISQTGYIDIDNIQGEVRGAMQQVLGVSPNQGDVSVDANIKKVFGLRD